MEIEQLLENFEVGKKLKEIKMYTQHGNSFYRDVTVKKIEGKYITASAIKEKDNRVELTMDFGKIIKVDPFPPVNGSFSYMLTDIYGVEIQCTIIL